MIRGGAVGARRPSRGLPKRVLIEIGHRETSRLKLRKVNPASTTRSTGMSAHVRLEPLDCPAPRGLLARIEGGCGSVDDPLAPPSRLPARSRSRMGGCQRLPAGSTRVRVGERDEPL
jgi:hypothetical protein